MKHLSVQSSMNGLKSPVILLCFNSSGARVADTCTKTLCHYFFGEVAFVLLILIHSVGARWPPFGKSAKDGPVPYH